MKGEAGLVKKVQKKRTIARTSQKMQFTVAAEIFKKIS
jgi:ribosomal protein S19E (S16A)